METVEVDREQVGAILCFANGMPSAAGRHMVVAWIASQYGDDVLTPTYDRRDDGAVGFKVICHDLNKTFVF